jgi:alpha(1,3/1,4) fucosyltransferase
MEGEKIALYIDPPSHHFLQDKLFNVQDGRLNGEQLLAPYAKLREDFAARDIVVRTADYMPEAVSDTHNIYVSMGMLDKYKRMAQRSDTTVSAYFAMECPIVEPSFFKQLPEASHYFKRIFSWSNSKELQPVIGQSLPLHHFYWPQSFDDVHEHVWCNQARKFMVMINSNKLPRLYWQELYTERLRAVEYFSHRGEIDLYGVGWDKPGVRVGKTWVPYTLRRLIRSVQGYWQRLYPDPQLVAAQRVYKGIAPTKSAVLGQYKFALCFENMVLKGWITEKIFDCFFAGAIPIYWGEPEIQKYIPAECFIDMRQFADYATLANFLYGLTERQIQTYKENARAFLRSEKFRPFSKDAFVDIFWRILQEDTGHKFSSKQVRC